jgi:hypothetical protein
MSDAANPSVNATVPRAYETLPGEEYHIEDEGGSFWCKLLPEPSQHAQSGMM